MKCISKPSDGWLYGPSRKGTVYKCMEYHRRPMLADKVLWHRQITRADESDLFDQAESGGWTDHRRNHWWASPGLELELGENGEVCAYFPVPANESDPAHGYPVTGLRASSRPFPDDVAKKLVRCGQLDEVDRMRLKGRKL